MVNDTILGFARTLISTRTAYFFDTASIPTQNTTGTTLTIITSQFLSYAAAIFVFIMSFLGGLQTASHTIQWVEDSFSDFLRHYSLGQYNFAEIMKSENENKALEDMLTGYTVNLMLYSFLSFAHAMFLLVIGGVSSNILFQRTKALITTSVDIPINDAIRMLLFSVLIGSLDFIAGQVVASKAQEIVTMLGFNTNSDNSS